MQSISQDFVMGGAGGLDVNVLRLGGIDDTETPFGFAFPCAA